MKINFVFPIALAILMAPQQGEAGRCKNGGVRFEGKSYCLVHDPELIQRVYQRNQAINILNESHRLNVQVSSLISQKTACTKEPLKNRDAQFRCLQELRQVRHGIEAALKRSEELRQRMAPLAVQPVLKEKFEKKSLVFETRAKGVLTAAEASIKHSEEMVNTALKTWIDKKGAVARANGANASFCARLSDTATEPMGNLATAMSASLQGDMYEMRRLYSESLRAAAIAESGYKLCNRSSDTLLQNSKATLKEFYDFLKSQDPKANLRKACSSAKVAQWPSLARGCQAGTQSEEFQYSLHQALVGKFSEEK
jgi:hypothetical protein